MSKKKEKYRPLVFESEMSFIPNKKDGSSTKDVSANIYLSMLQSQAWHNLKDKQKVLYLYCKAQYFGEKKIKSQLMTFIEKENNENVDLSKRFTMNKSKWCDIYDLYNDNTQRYFYNDMKTLEQNGFIRVIESGKNTRTKNIYEFSDEWRAQGPHKSR